MKILNVLLLVFALSQHLSAQNINESYTKLDDRLRIGKDKTNFLPYNNRGYTLILPDSAAKLTGLLFLLRMKKLIY